MITIKNVKAVVLDKDKKLFGFDFKLFSGLNIISGENSGGKSTTLSCIYYCLGMEQLLGGYNEDSISDSLKKDFKYNNTTYQVFDSYTEIEIENEKKETAIIKRVIKSAYNEKTNIVEISLNGGAFEKKFLHSQGDTNQDEGFYNWLSVFTSVHIPVFITEDNKERKILYLQHIFASAFVEQTKGWSDFFAQLPYFSTTKKPKQKIVEYVLGLKGLSEEFALDVLKEKEALQKRKWNEQVESFKIVASHYNYDVPNLSDQFDSSLKPAKIDQLPLQTEDENGTKTTIVDAIEKLKRELVRLQRANTIDSVIEPQKLELSKKHTEIKEKIEKLKSQFEKIETEKINETSKESKYGDIIKQLNKEINTLEGLKKINNYQGIELKEIDNCPVCNSSLNYDTEVVLKNLDKIDSTNSIVFYKSEKALYESYLENSSKLRERYNKIILYYRDQIAENQKLLDEINKELTSDSRIPSRSSITEEITIKFEVDKLIKINESFAILKSDLKAIAEELADVRFKKNAISENKSADGLIVDDFKKNFIELLKSFGYPKEVLNRIQIQDEEPSKLLPVIKNFGENVPQPIRLKSSASDFIRALWAYYLALLIKGKNHVGLLVFDEPGQHAMKLDSMKALIKATKVIKDKQVILAISKDKSKDVKYVLSDILDGLKGNEDYHINIIDDEGKDNKLIKPLNSEA